MEEHNEIELKEVFDSLIGSLDFAPMEEFLHESIRTRVDLGELISRVATEGLGAIDAEAVTTFVFDCFFYEISVARPMFLKMLLISLLFSVAQRFLVTKNKYIADVGFLLLYSTLVVILMQSFLLAAQLVRNGMEMLLEFLSALIPTYALTMVLSGHGVSGAILYELAFILVYLVEWGMCYLLGPLIHIFVVVKFLNHLLDEDKLSKLTELIEKGIHLALKTAFGAVIGLSVVQSMIGPAKDYLSKHTVLAGLSSLPGVGNVIGSAGDIVLSCGVLIKNSVGVVGIILLVFLAVIPVLKTGVFCLMYQLLSIMLQPVADKRITECVSAAAKGLGLYMRLIVYTMLLFFVLFSVMGMATGMMR